MAGYGLDVLRYGGRQGLWGPLLLLDPGGQLRVPDEGVAAEDLALLSCEVRRNVALGEVEDSLLGFGEEPLWTCQRKRRYFDAQPCITFWPLVGVVCPNMLLLAKMAS